MPKKGYKQTDEHRSKNAAARKGKPRPHAKGWVTRGYRFVMDGEREIAEHRLVMERHIGRRLLRCEHVHHINGDRLDNRIENLGLLTISEHTTIHNNGKSRKGQSRRGWTEQERDVYMAAIRRRPPPSEETKAKIAESMRKVRAERFWSSHGGNHETVS